MALSAEETRIIVGVMDNLHKAAARDAAYGAAQRFAMIRDALATSTGDLDQKLVMELQTVLMALHEGGQGGSLSEEAKQRVRQVCAKLDVGRETQ